MGNQATRERLTSAGFTVGGERYRALPTDYTIIGGNGPNDRTADQLLALYPDDTAKHKRARGIILGARDRLRVAQPPPRPFIDTCRNGIVQDVGAADLGEDKKGRTWVVILVGRQRIMSRRILDAEGAKAKPPEPALYVMSTLAAFVGKDFDAELAALEINAASNSTVPEPLSVKADRATAFAAKGMAAADIACRISMLAEHIPLLTALALCEPCVQEAVDAMRVPLNAAPRLSKLSPDEQARQMTRKDAGPGKAAKDAAAPVRQKARSPKTLISVASELEKIGFLDAAELIRWMQGGPPPVAYVKAIESAEEGRRKPVARQGARMTKGSKSGKARGS